MRIYTVILLQLMVWSGFTVMEWLSRYDQPIYNLAMFIVFTYIAFAIGKWMLRSLKTTILVTAVSLLAYSGLLALLKFFFPIQF